LDALFSKKSEPGDMSMLERKNASVLIVDSDGTIRNNLRQGLVSIGFGTIIDAPNHSVALKKIEQRAFTHVIFESKQTNMPPRDFLLSALECDSALIGIPASYEPTIDEVFDLLVAGARGYIVKPFTTGTLDESIVMATKGDPISDCILRASDRNEALASLVITTLDRLALVMRQAQQFETARREVPKKAMTFRRTIDIGRTFSKGGPLKLTEIIAAMCIEHSSGPTTRLSGNVKKRSDAKNTASGVINARQI